MKLRTVGLRVALFGILALVLGAVMVTTGGAGGFAPSEVLAGETVGVPTAANPAHVAARVSGVGPVRSAGLGATLSAARVSPFFATPVLNGMQMKARLSASPLARTGSCADFFQLQNNSDTEWWIYTGGHSAGVWGCIEAQAPGVTTVTWNWVLLQSDGTTPLAFCAAYDVPVPEDVYSFPYGGGCAVNYYDYFDYECVGDEQFAVSYKFSGQSWVGPLFNYNGPEYGCAEG